MNGLETHQDKGRSWARYKSGARDTTEQAMDGEEKSKRPENPDGIYYHKDKCELMEQEHFRGNLNFGKEHKSP